ncbi:MAG: hypothetical protein ACRD8U_19125 [Pyrinomonadaceae bacterium]
MQQRVSHGRRIRSSGQRVGWSGAVGGAGTLNWCEPSTGQGVSGEVPRPGQRTLTWQQIVVAVAWQASGKRVVINETQFDA